MGPNASAFFADIVEPTVAEFEARPHDIRRGRLAAIVLNHMLDYYALEGFPSRDRSPMNEKVKAARAAMTAQCSDFALIGDVADASKHSKLAHAKAPRLIASAEQVSAPPGLFQAPFGHGFFAEAVQVVVTMDDGTTQALLPAIRKVMSVWKSMP